MSTSTKMIGVSHHFLWCRRKSKNSAKMPGEFRSDSRTDASAWDAVCFSCCDIVAPERRGGENCAAIGPARGSVLRVSQGLDRIHFRGSHGRINSKHDSHDNRDSES